ncbi:MAG: hypothetical protein Q8N62_01160 [Candidatus Omnitrophota bacterium]|nr:hypothetical protein [Candidatus Omnitrophota bacterium]
MNSVHLKRIITSIVRCGIILFIILLNCLLYNSAAAAMDGSDKKIAEEKCSKCHGLERVFSFKRTLREWAVIIQRMQEKDPAWLKDKDAVSCGDFVKLNYSKTGKDLFESSCVNCHVAANKKHLLYQRKTRQSWESAIERMRRKYVLVIGIADSKLIKEFWSDPKNNKDLKLNVEESDIIKDVFEDKCGRCHTYNFMYGQKRTIRDWTEILNRMQGKSPVWIDSQDLKQIKEHIFSNNEFLLEKN